MERIRIYINKYVASFRRGRSALCELAWVVDVLVVGRPAGWA
jgi:hypothetical protein